MFECILCCFSEVCADAERSGGDTGVHTGPVPRAIEAPLQQRTKDASQPYTTHV